MDARRRESERRGPSRLSGFGMAPLGIGGTVILLVLSLFFGRDFVSGRGERQRIADVERRSAAGSDRRQKRRKSSSCRSCSTTAQETGRTAPAVDGHAVARREARALPRRDADGVRHRPDRDGAVLLPVDEKVYIDLAFYDELQHAVRRAGRLRAGVRDRARARPPRAAPARHRRKVRRAQQQRSRRGERAVGAARAAGRLLRRRLGDSTQQREHPRAGRRRGRR